MKYYILSLSVMLILVVSIPGCKKDSVGVVSFIKVSVVDENNNPISEAIVKCGGVTTTSDVSGDATLLGAVADDGKYKIEVVANNFFMGYRNINEIDGSAGHAGTVKLISMENIGTTDANSANTLQGNNFRLELNGNGFATETGQSVSGEVTVFGRYISASQMGLLSETMPGGDFSAVGQSGEDGILESYGFTAFEFRDASGTRVVPNGNSAEVAITVGQEALDQLNSEGANVWFFNDQSFNWSFGGDIATSGEDVFMPVTSSTFGNCDKIRAQGIVQGHLVCESDEVPSTFTTVVLRGDYGYAMEYTTSSNNNGDFRLEVGVPSGGGNYTVNALNYSDFVWVSPNQVNDIGTVDVCSLSGADGSPRFNLRWDANVDLDLYVQSPSGEIISYNDYTSSDGGELDIDCTCSCGSENVFWADGGPAGAYTYWVDYYGECDGSAVPASFTIVVRNNGRVVDQVSGTVNENGQSTDFTYVR
ncbi:MAG: hypothetical protein ACI85F_001082 [Bacteroidia bacterium]|jgi:hypothetical protein